jgi:hypothetical protein
MPGQTLSHPCHALSHNALVRRAADVVQQGLIPTEQIGAPIEATDAAGAGSMQIRR